MRYRVIPRSNVSVLAIPAFAAIVIAACVIGMRWSSAQPFQYETMIDGPPDITWTFSPTASKLGFRRYYCNEHRRVEYVGIGHPSSATELIPNESAVCYADAWYIADRVARRAHSSVHDLPR